MNKKKKKVKHNDKKVNINNEEKKSKSEIIERVKPKEELTCKTEGADKATLVEDKLKNKNPYLFLILKYATSFSAIFAITVGVIPAWVNNCNNIMRNSYCSYLSLDNIPLNLGFSSYWNNLGIGIIACIIICYECFLLNIIKNKIKHKLMFYLCVCSETVLCFFILVIFMLMGIQGVLYMISELLQLAFIFIIMILSYFIFKYYTSNKSIIKKFFHIFIVGLLTYFIYPNKALEQFNFITVLGIVISVLFYIPYLVEIIDNYFTSDKENSSITNKNKNKKTLFLKLKVFLTDDSNLAVYYALSTIVIVFILSCFLIYSENLAINSYKESGIKMLREETVHQIFEEENKKYLLLETENHEKIIMRIANPNTEKGDDDFKTYYVDKGEFSYWTDYDRMVIKTEKCKIEVKGTILENKETMIKLVGMIEKAITDGI